MTPALRRLGRALLLHPNDRRWCSELCEASGLKSGTVSPLLKKLENLGWVEHDDYVDPVKKSKRFYRLTELGEMMLAAIVWSGPR